MSKPRVLVMVDLSGAPQALEVLSQVAQVDCMTANRQKLLEEIPNYDAFWGHVDLKVDAEVLAQARKLKVVNTTSTGTDHIDKEELSRRGITMLSITRDYKLLDAFTATAECAWMLLLACQRHFRRATKAVLTGRWECMPFCGEQLAEQTLGVLGVGRLGKMIVEYGKAFRMKVLGCDLKGVDIAGVQEVELPTLLAESDSISIHLHMLKQNYHLFNRDTFARMKDGAVLVNTSRGDIIDESALLEVLKTGKLAAFGADVLHNEWRKDMRESLVVQYAQTHDNVIVTPHIGGCTTKSVWDARVFSARKLAQWLTTGKELTM